MTDGVLYGVGVGYDFQAGGAVFGIEGEATDSTTDECVGDVVIQRRRPVRRRRPRPLCRRPRRRGGRAQRPALRQGRLHQRPRPRSTMRTAPPAPPPTSPISANLDGVRVGAGAQFGIGSNAYLRTEYRYSNYQDGRRPPPGGRRLRLPLLTAAPRTRRAGAATLRPFFLRTIHWRARATVAITLPPTSNIARSRGNR